MVLGGFGWFWLVPCFSNYALSGAQIWQPEADKNICRRVLL